MAEVASMVDSNSVGEEHIEGEEIVQKKNDEEIKSLLEYHSAQLTEIRREIEQRRNLAEELAVVRGWIQRRLNREVSDEAETEDSGESLESEDHDEENVESEDQSHDDDDTGQSHSLRVDELQTWEAYHLERLNQLRSEIQRRIDIVHEEYEKWKSIAPLVYDVITTRALEWPSPTVEWLPHREEPAGLGSYLQKMILGTHASERNYLIIARVNLPLEGYNQNFSHYDDQNSGRSANRFQIIQKIDHNGEVQRARYMPQKEHIIATKPKKGVYIFDCNKHSSDARIDGACNPQLRLRGYSTEGRGLSWSMLKEGRLLSTDGTLICLWDIKAPAHPTNNVVDPMQTFKIHEGIVRDVAWNQKNEHLFASVGDDMYLRIWDCRAPPLTESVASVVAHRSEVYSLSFNPFNESLLATGSTDTTVKIFDMRKISPALYTFVCHKEAVTQVGWNPMRKNILASSCRRLMVWDLSRIGEEQTAEEARDGPPELVFVHRGHKDIISDFSWNQYDDRVAASVDVGKIVNIWKKYDEKKTESADEPEGE